MCDLNVPPFFWSKDYVLDWFWQAIKQQRGKVMIILVSFFPAVALSLSQRSHPKGQRGGWSFQPGNLKLINFRDWSFVSRLRNDPLIAVKERWRTVKAGIVPKWLKCDHHPLYPSCAVLPCCLLWNAKEHPAVFWLQKHWNICRQTFAVYDWVISTIEWVNGDIWEACGNPLITTTLQSNCIQATIQTIYYHHQIFIPALCVHLAFPFTQAAWPGAGLCTASI